MASTAVKPSAVISDLIKNTHSSDSGLETGSCDILNYGRIVTTAVQPSEQSGFSQQTLRDHLLQQHKSSKDIVQDDLETSSNSSSSDDSCDESCCAAAGTPLLLKELKERKLADPAALQRKILQAKLQASRPKRKIRPVTKVNGWIKDKADDRKNPPEDEPKRNYCGVLLAFLSGILFTLSSAGIKLAEHIDPTMLLLIRTVEQSVILLPAVIYLRLNPFTQRGYRLLLLLQGCIGCGVLIFIFVAFNRLPVGDATAIIFSSPVVVVLVSFLVFGESCSLLKTLSILLLLTGVTLISKPSFIFGFTAVDSNMTEIQTLMLPAEINSSRVPVVFYALPSDYPVRISLGRIKRQLEDPAGTSADLYGLAAALLGTLFMAMNYVVTRQLRQVHFACLLFTYSCVATVASALLVFSTGAFQLPQTVFDWTVALMIGITGLGGQVLLVAALRKETASTVSIVRCLDIVFAYVLQVIFFGDVPQLMNLCGALAVGIAVLLVTLDQSIKNFFVKCFSPNVDHTKRFLP